MSLDPARYIGELNTASPPNSDPPVEGADQIRTTKKAVKDTFPFFPPRTSETTSRQYSIELTCEEINDLPDAIADITAQTLVYNDLIQEPPFSAVPEISTQEALDSTKVLIDNLDAIVEDMLLEARVVYAEQAAPDPELGKEGDLWYWLD
jgi:hypothetical protein